jgi:putative sigma-54 modulation protein
VHARNGHVDDEIRELAAAKVLHAGRILDDDGGTADVEFAERTNPRLADERYRVEITTVLKGRTVRVEAAAADDRAALDIAVDKFERQLRRLKERLVQRHRGQGATRNGPAPDPVAPSGEVPDMEPAGSDSGDDPANVVRVKRFELRPMSVDEASLQMDMLGHAFFFFLDAETGHHCVLYHRNDGALGLIESV